MRGEAVVVERRGQRLRAAGVVIRQRAAVEEVAPLRDAGERRADAAGAYDEDPHGGQFYLTSGSAVERRAVGTVVRSRRFPTSGGSS